MKNRSLHSLAFLRHICAGLILAPAAALAQGSLTPPGAPVPTMRSLEQVEPRRPISASSSISQSGSYYLTTNINTAVGGALLINADNVTLDLNGFAISAGTGGNGVSVNSPQQNIRIVNGSIRNCGSHGVSGSNIRNGQFANLLVTGNGGNGLVIGTAGVVRDCTVLSNNLIGIQVNNGTLVTHCT